MVYALGRYIESPDGHPRFLQEDRGRVDRRMHHDGDGDGTHPKADPTEE